MEQVVFNGVDLTERYVVAGIRRPLPTAAPRYEEVPSGDRRFMRGVDLEPPEISFRIIARSLDEDGRRQAARELASLLLVQEEAALAFSGDAPLYYRVVPSGAFELNEFVRCGYMDATFMAVEAAMYGASRSVSVSAGGSTTIYVGGTYRTALKVTSASATRDGGDYLYGVRLDSAKTMCVTIPTASASKVVMDSAARTATVGSGGAVAQLTLASDWFEAEPGRHTIANHKGSGAFTVEWVERWL